MPPTAPGMTAVNVQVGQGSLPTGNTAIGTGVTTYATINVNAISIGVIDVWLYSTCLIQNTGTAAQTITMQGALDGTNFNPFGVTPNMRLSAASSGGDYVVWPITYLFSALNTSNNHTILLQAAASATGINVVTSGTPYILQGYVQGPI